MAGGRGSGGEAVVPADAAAEAQSSTRQDRELRPRCPGRLQVSLIPWYTLLERPMVACSTVQPAARRLEESEIFFSRPGFHTR